MKLILDEAEIKNILLAWAQRHIPDGQFNTIELATYTYLPTATFTSETPDEAL